MNSRPFYSLILFLLFCLYSLAVAVDSTSLNTSELFENWCKQHGKTYSSTQEKLDRFRVFEDNLAFVNRHNELGNSSYTLSLNVFADLTHHEFKASRLGLSPYLLRVEHKQQSRDQLVNLADVPYEIDWRKKGAVTPVKDQGSYGACWAFSAIGAIEGINKIATGTLTSLSEQELIDSERSYNSGCNGGLMNYAFQFVIDNHVIDTEEDYSYIGRSKSYNKYELRRYAVTIDGYTDVSPNNENELLKAVANQPITAGICGSERSFQLYSGGIFSGPCSTSLDHAVLIVGYGLENGKDYWIVKNSWGAEWGMKGYMHIVRNSGNSAGVCGINMLASYPIKTSPNPPSPSSRGRIKCDGSTTCREGQTCCCLKHLIGVCFYWKCCPFESVCCADLQYCCPQDHPICSTERGPCLNRAGNSTVAKSAMYKSHFSRPRSWNPVVDLLDK